MDSFNYDHLKFLIERFDHYYDTVNNKSSFYIALNTFIFGGVTAGYIAINEKKMPLPTLIWYLAMALLLACTLSTIFTILAIRPYRNSNHTNSQSKSLIFYSDIACHKVEYLKEKIANQTNDDRINDLTEQMHSLAFGLDRKFKYLSFASKCLIAEYILLFPLIVLIIINNVIR
jgi:hypothetical protein